MKNMLILLFLLFLISGPKSFLTTRAAVSDWKNEDSLSVSFSGETVLENEFGDRGVLAVHTADNIILSTKIELELKLEKFGGNANTDIFKIQLMTATQDGLVIVFFDEIGDNEIIRNIKTKFYKEGIEINCQSFKQTNNIISGTNEITNEFTIEIEYSEDRYLINFNNKEKIELKADIIKEEKAILSLELKSGEPSFHSPEVEIAKIILHVKEPEKNKQESSSSEYSGAETNENKPEQGQKSDSTLVKDLKAKKDGNSEYPAIIAAAAISLIAGITILVIKQRKQKKQN